MNYLYPIVSALVTLALIAVFQSGRFAGRFQDIPNERSLHSTPVPRIGGVGLIGGVLSGWALILGALPWWLVLPLLALFAVSLLDDMYGLPVRQRLFVHVVAAAVLVGASGLWGQQGIAVMLVALLLTVWMTNLYNFMDGSDGLAGGMALTGFACYGIAALLAHDGALATLNFAVSASALAFLCYNFPPARVFMGDAGSIPLGFLAAAMGLWGWQKGHWPAWFPLLVFSPFIADASVTLAKRTWRGARITEAHREHYYQRAIQRGQSHRNVALTGYALMLASGMSALYCLQQALPWALLLAWSGFYAAFMFFLDSRWKK